MGEPASRWGTSRPAARMGRGMAECGARPAPRPVSSGTRRSMHAPAGAGGAGSPARRASPACGALGRPPARATRGPEPADGLERRPGPQPACCTAAAAAPDGPPPARASHPRSAGAYKYIEELWKRKQSDVLRFLLRVRCWEYRQLPGIVRLTRPSRPDKARRMGFKAKQGYVVYRVRVRRGGRKKPVSKVRFAKRNSCSRSRARQRHCRQMQRAGSGQAAGAPASSGGSNGSKAACTRLARPQGCCSRAEWRAAPSLPSPPPLPPPAGHCLRQARAPGCDAAEAHPQPAQRGRGARGAQVRRPARAEQLLGQPGALRAGPGVGRALEGAGRAAAGGGDAAPPPPSPTLGLLPRPCPHTHPPTPCAQDAVYKYFEVILVDPAHKAIRKVRPPAAVEERALAAWRRARRLGHAAALVGWVSGQPRRRPGKPAAASCGQPRVATGQLERGHWGGSRAVAAPGAAAAKPAGGERSAGSSGSCQIVCSSRLGLAGAALPHGSASAQPAAPQPACGAGSSGPALGSSRAGSAAACAQPCHPRLCL